jgi:hypothetical protein
MKTYSGNNKIENCTNLFIEQVAKSLKADFIYSKAMDMYGIKYQGINIYFFDTLIAVVDDNECIEKIYALMSDVEHQIDFIKQ